MKENLKKIIIFSFILLFLFVGCELKLSDKNKMKQEDVLEAVNSTFDIKLTVDEFNENIGYWVNHNAHYIINQKGAFEKFLAEGLFPLSASKNITQDEASTLIGDNEAINAVGSMVEKYLNRNYSEMTSKVITYLDEKDIDNFRDIPEEQMNEWLDEVKNKYEDSDIELNPIPLRAYIDGESYKIELDGISASEISKNLGPIYKNDKIWYKDEPEDMAQNATIETVVKTYHEDIDYLIIESLDFLDAIEFEILDSEITFNNLVDDSIDIGSGDAEILEYVTNVCENNKGKELFDLEFRFKSNGNTFVIKINAIIKENPVLTSFDDMDWLDLEWNIYTDADVKQLKRTMNEFWGFIISKFA